MFKGIDLKRHCFWLVFFMPFYLLGQELDTSFIRRVMNENQILFDATNESREITSYKLENRLPYNRELSILIVKDGNQISASKFKAEFEAGKFDHNKFTIILDLNKIRQLTENKLIKYVILIE